MIKNKFIIIIFFVGFITSSFGQVENTEDFLRKEISKEQVYLHINSSLLLTGEKLLYKFYALESDTGQLSDLSKIGRVELINNKGEILFRHKVKLENGQGFSDFFVPSDLSSGAYKIVAYTNWMLNAKDNYFQQDLHLLNPYQKNNSGIDIKENIILNQKISESNSGDLNLSLNKNTFNNREQVNLGLENSNELSGNFSLSVRRIDSIDKPRRVKSTAFKKLYKNVAWSFNDTIFYPEIRGAFFKASIEAENSELLSGKNMVISSPGEEGQMQIVSIDKNEEFSFILNEIPDDDGFIFQVLNEKNLLYDINLIKHPNPGYNNLSFITPVLAQNFREYILEKSINIQIENAYATTKTDRFINLDRSKYFFEKELITYNLEDYNSFPDVSKTFTEIIQFGRIRRNDQGENIFLVRSKKPYVEFKEPALLIVDGVVVQDHEKLIGYNPQQIKNISILRDKLFFGPSVFQGAIIVDTKEGDFPTELVEHRMISKEIKIPQKLKIYYSPNYQTNTLNRIPDYRYQLLWEPLIELIGEKKEFSFYTSDLDGKFELNLEGFTSEGQPISISKIFKVE